MQGNGGQGPAFLLDGDSLFGFDSLMQTFGIAPPKHEAAGVFVDNNNLVIFDYVMPVILKQRFGFEGLFDVMDGIEIFFVEIFDIQFFFQFFETIISQVGGAQFFVHGIIGTHRQIFDDIGKLVVLFRWITVGSRDD